MANNHRPWQPPPNPNQGPPPGVISIQDLISMYGFLTNLTSPATETRTKIITNIEAVLLNFSKSLSAGVSEQ